MSARRRGGGRRPAKQDGHRFLRGQAFAEEVRAHDLSQKRWPSIPIGYVSRDYGHEGTRMGEKSFRATLDEIKSSIVRRPVGRQSSWEELATSGPALLREAGDRTRRGADLQARRAKNVVNAAARRAQGIRDQWSEPTWRLRDVAPSFVSKEPRRGRMVMVEGLIKRSGVAFGLGYVLGARAGRERYEQLQGWWNSLIGNPTV